MRKPNVRVCQQYDGNKKSVTLLLQLPEEPFPPSDLEREKKKMVSSKTHFYDDAVTLYGKGVSPAAGSAKIKP